MVQTGVKSAGCENKIPHLESTLSLENVKGNREEITNLPASRERI